MEFIVKIPNLRMFIVFSKIYSPVYKLETLDFRILKSFLGFYSKSYFNVFLTVVTKDIIAKDAMKKLQVYDLKT